MTPDWKETLSTLRGKLDDPTIEENQNIEIEEVKSKYRQRDPLKVIIDKKGRNGKTATIIEGFILPKEEVEEIAKTLKQKLGVGGSVREGEILIQGDHKNTVITLLQNLHFKTKC